LVWAVSIEGDENDLLAAERYFGGAADGRVMKISLNFNAARWVLVSARFEDFADESEVASEAQAILNVMNGLLFGDDPRSVPIQVSGSVHKRASNGNWGVAIFVPVGHVRIGTCCGLPVEQSEFLAKTLNSAARIRREPARMV
jgi:hypothetical protein